MRTFDVFEIGQAPYLVVEAEHPLDLDTIVLVPILPSDALPSISRLTVDARIGGNPYRVRAHMPPTVEAQRLRHMQPLCRLSADEGEKVMDGLNVVLWGL